MPIVPFLATLILALLALGHAAPAAAQTGADIEALRQAVDALRDSQQRMERDLAEIKTLLRGRQQAAAPEEDATKVVLAVDGDPFKGQPTAKLVLVEFTDYQ
jgi:protein-disulfide isomerase